MRQNIKHVAVIGAGTIGASWAAYFLSRGLSVTASDPDDATCDVSPSRTDPLCVGVMCSCSAKGRSALRRQCGRAGDWRTHCHI
jgi:glycine/D-amino acid oxidase-like deaminating enzyme